MWSGEYPEMEAYLFKLERQGSALFSEVFHQKRLPKGVFG